MLSTFSIAKVNNPMFLIIANDIANIKISLIIVNDYMRFDEETKFLITVSVLVSDIRLLIRTRAHRSSKCKLLR